MGGHDDSEGVFQLQSPILAGVLPPYISHANFEPLHPHLSSNSSCVDKTMGKLAVRAVRVRRAPSVMSVWLSPYG
jgi:hypothetical protein